MENKILLVLGVAAIISGILLSFQNQYLIGISGSIVGLWLLIHNLKKIRNKPTK